MRPILATLLVALALLASEASAQCASRRVRKEFSDLTPAEAKAFVDGMKKIYTTSAINKYVDMHVQNNLNAHNSPQFLPWHRYMVHMFETELLAAAPGLSGLPYWEASYNARNPGSAFVFREDILGTASPNGGCLAAPFSELRDANGKCIVRRAQQGFTLHSPEIVAGIIGGSSDYYAFERAIEYGQHSSVHNFISGNMGNVAFSPTDPAFWANHCGVDRAWAAWQDVGDNYAKYGGTWNGREASTSDTFQGKTMAQLIDYKNNLCYEYQPPRNAVAGRVPFPLGGASATTSATATATSTSATAAPTATPIAGNITVPSTLTDDFIKQFNLDGAQAARAHELVVFMVSRLNERIARGEKVPTLTDLASLTGTKPSGSSSGSSAATPTPSLSAAAAPVAGTLAGVAAAALSVLFGMA
ncbi:hypothetical protein H9P43_000326 [Blastocladiella emersonii ATCC 22665]|nr:hypothetical protein H9P43_000326 [Blastocladiella emersonii ATCC 22665]